MLNNAWEGARQRLAGIETMADDGTIRYLDACDIDEGWECLDAGAGAGSIAKWLCDQVGPGGYVVATDVNTRFLEAICHPNLEVRMHDIVVDELPENAFDLAHERALLAHLEDPRDGLDRLIAAVKPGGWVIVEEFDFLSVVPGPNHRADASALFERVMTAHNHVLSARFDPFYGRRLLHDVGAHELTDIEAEGRTLMLEGGSGGARAFQLTFDQLREPMLRSGMISAHDIDDVLVLLDDEDWMFMSMVIMAVRGRKPEAA